MRRKPNRHRYLVPFLLPAFALVFYLLAGQFRTAICQLQNHFAGECAMRLPLEEYYLLALGVSFFVAVSLSAWVYYRDFEKGQYWLDLQDWKEKSAWRH